MHVRHNPYRYHAPSGWSDMASAPRDGTIIETQNNWGIAPTFGLHHFVDGNWENARDPNCRVSEGAHLSWRPYTKDVSDYVDPTGGAQFTHEYWLFAAGVSPPQIKGMGGGSTPLTEESPYLPAGKRKNEGVTFNRAQPPKRGWFARLIFG